MVMYKFIRYVIRAYMAACHEDKSKDHDTAHTESFGVTVIGPPVLVEWKLSIFSWLIGSHNGTIEIATRTR